MPNDLLTLHTVLRSFELNFAGFEPQKAVEKIFLQKAEFLLTQDIDQGIIPLLSYPGALKSLEETGDFMGRIANTG